MDEENFNLIAVVTEHQNASAFYRHRVKSNHPNHSAAALAVLTCVFRTAAIASSTRSSHTNSNLSRAPTGTFVEVTSVPCWKYEHNRAELDQ